MTPVWLGALGWMSMALFIASLSLVFVSFGWIGAAIFLLYAFVGGALVDVVTPIPSYKACIALVRKELEKDVVGSRPSMKGDVVGLFLSSLLLKKVKSIQEDLPSHKRYF